MVHIYMQSLCLKGNPLPFINSFSRNCVTDTAQHDGRKNCHSAPVTPNKQKQKTYGKKNIPVSKPHIFWTPRTWNFLAVSSIHAYHWKLVVEAFSSLARSMREFKKSSPVCAFIYLFLADISFQLACASFTPLDPGWAHSGWAFLWCYLSGIPTPTHGPIC